MVSSSRSTNQTAAPGRRCTLTIFDPQSVERFRTLAPRDAYREVKQAIFRMGGSSEDFLDAFGELVEAGVLTWADVDRFEAE